MGFCNPAGEIKAQSKPAGTAAAGRIRAVKRLGDARQVLLGNAGAMIPDAEDHKTRLEVQLHLDRRCIRRAVAERILDQVLHDQAQADFVHFPDHRDGGQLEVNALVPVIEVGHDQRLQHAAQLDGTAPEGGMARIQALTVEQVGDQVLHLPDIAEQVVLYLAVIEELEGHLGAGER